MGQFLRVNGDYNIRAGDGAKITLDTGPAASGGSVRVTGNLVVEGDTFNISTTNLTIEDNIISLNTGEVGPGVSLVYSGIEIERGNTSSITPQNNASFLYDESTDAWILAHGSAPGPFNFDSSSLRLKKILTNSTTDLGDLTLIGTGDGLVKVSGTTAYEAQILAREAAVPGSVDDVLPNKKYVDDSIQNNPTFQIVAPQSQDTRVVIADKEITPNTSGQAGSLAYFTATTTHSTYGESAVSIVVDGDLVGQFYTNRFEVGDLEIGGGIDRNEITSKAGITSENIVIRTQGTGKVVFNYALQLDRIGTSGETPPTAFPYTPSTPAYVSGSILVYSSSAGTGSTGLWFVNDTLDAASNPGTGELISKNKALVFSMLF
jgi:hypothetical protein